MEYKKLKTRIYIDGYNFYYGCLKGTHHKWLDPVKLCETLLKRCGQNHSQLPTQQAVKFFTADISGRAASDETSLNDQRAYHHALAFHCKNRLEIIKGSYDIDKKKLPKVELDEAGNVKEPRHSTRVNVWKMEEKQSDVNVALEALFDVATDLELEQVVFVTNDTDIVPALQKIKLYNNKKLRSPVKIGLIIPIPNGSNSNRRANKSLTKESDWTIPHIEECELEQTQLPCRIVGGRKTAIKPIQWFKYPEKVARIIEILNAKELEGSVPKSWKWLSKPLYPADGLPISTHIPIDVMDDLNELEIILEHVTKYAKSRMV